jgi:hypothetical protein
MGAGNHINSTEDRVVALEFNKVVENKKDAEIENENKQYNTL